MYKHFARFRLKRHVVEQDGKDSKTEWMLFPVLPRTHQIETSNITIEGGDSHVLLVCTNCFKYLGSFITRKEQNDYLVGH